MSTSPRPPRQIWHYSFYHVLCAAPEQHPLLLTEPPNAISSVKEKVSQVSGQGAGGLGPGLTSGGRRLCFAQRPSLATCSLTLLSPVSRVHKAGPDVTCPRAVAKGRKSKAVSVLSLLRPRARAAPRRPVWTLPRRDQASGLQLTRGHQLSWALLRETSGRPGPRRPTDTGLMCPGSLAPSLHPAGGGGQVPPACQPGCQPPQCRPADPVRDLQRACPVCGQPSSAFSLRLRPDLG